MSTSRPSEPSRATLVQGTPRGQRIVVLMAALGRRLGAAIGEGLGNPELAANVPVLILCELAQHGSLRPRDLLRSTQLTSGGMTKQLDHLEELGLITRSFGTLRHDRRGAVIALTPDGARAAAVIAAAVEDHLEDLRSLVTEIGVLLDE